MKSLVGILSIVCLLLGTVNANGNTVAQQKNDSGSYEKLPSNSEALDLQHPINLAKEFFISIPPLNAAEALNRFAKQTGIQMLYSYEQALTRKARPVVGQYSAMDALALLLKDSGLEVSLSDKGAITISDSEKVAQHNQRERTNMNSKIIAKKTLLATFVGLFATTGAVQQAYGQDGEAATAQFRIDEIIVTAQKREQKLLDVPMSVAALSGEQLAAQGVGDLQSLSLAVPGLLVAESGSFQRRISIRGIGNTFGSSSLVGMYLDEASVASLPANQIDLRAHDLERVEVLKGPQGTLYGEGSVGGTIRYITKDPQLDDFSGETSIDGSTLQDGESSQEVKGIVNIPLAEDWGLRVVGQYVNSGGWIDQPALSKSDINDYELFNIRAKLLWQPSDDLDVKATAIVHRNDGGAQNQGEDEDGNYRQSFDDPSTPSSEDDYDLYNVLINYSLNDITLISSTSYLNSDKELNNFSNQCCFPTGTTGELWNVFADNWQTSAEILTQEFRITNDSSGPWNWTAGLFYKDAQLIPLDAKGALFGVPGGTLGVNLFSFSNFQQEESKSWAVFGETSYAVTEKLEIGAGLRYFEDDRQFRSAMTGPFQEETFDSLNPKFYISYGLTEEIRVYANAAKGFRSGGFNGAGEPPFDPESVLSYELGTKISALDGRLNTELAIFYSDYDDYQVIGTVPSLGINITSNAGQAEIQGIDLSLRLFASDHIELGLSGNYMDTEFKEINVTSTSYAVGDPLDLVPQYGYSLWGHYSFNWFDHSPGFFRADYSQQGKSHYRNRSFGTDYHSASDVIDMLNIRLGWEKSDWSLELYALNLLDERGFIGPFSIEKASARSRPRTIGLNLGVKF